MNVLQTVDRLRDATHGRHALLEEMPSQQRLLADDYELAEYRCLLERLFGFYDGLASAFATDDPWGARVRERAALLALDLRDLGANSSEVRALARCTELPLLDTHDRVLGCAYVIEGATLGGRVIVKHLQRAFRASPDTPMRFFAGDGVETGVRWQRSCAILNAEAKNVADVCKAACATFDVMAQWLVRASTRVFISV